MTKRNLYIRLSIIVILVSAFSSLVTLELYKNSCEVMGNSQGVKWRECDY